MSNEVPDQPLTQDKGEKSDPTNQYNMGGMPEPSEHTAAKTAGAYTPESSPEAIDAYIQHLRASTRSIYPLQKQLILNTTASMFERALFEVVTTELLDPFTLISGRLPLLRYHEGIITPDLEEIGKLYLQDPRINTRMVPPAYIQPEQLLIIDVDCLFIPNVRITEWEKAIHLIDAASSGLDVKRFASTFPPGGGALFAGLITLTITPWKGGGIRVEAACEPCPLEYSPGEPYFDKGTVTSVFENMLARTQQRLIELEALEVMDMEDAVERAEEMTDSAGALMTKQSDTGFELIEELELRATTPELFSVQLQRITADISERKFPTADGGYLMLSKFPRDNSIPSFMLADQPHYKPRPDMRLRSKVVSIVTADGQSEEIGPYNKVVGLSFHAIPAPGGTLEVTAVCTRLELVDYFHELLAAIRSKWGVGKHDTAQQGYSNEKLALAPEPDIHPNALSGQPVAPVAVRKNGQAGHPRYAEDEWARTEHYIKGRDKRVIYIEWHEKLKADNPIRYKALTDPKETFRKNMERKPK